MDFDFFRFNAQDIQDHASTIKNRQQNSIDYHLEQSS